MRNYGALYSTLIRYRSQLISWVNPDTRQHAANKAEATAVLAKGTKVNFLGDKEITQCTRIIDDNKPTYRTMQKLLYLTTHKDKAHNILKQICSNHGLQKTRTNLELLFDIEWKRHYNQ